MKFRLLVKIAATVVGLGVGGVVELGLGWLLLCLAGWRGLLGRLGGCWGCRLLCCGSLGRHWHWGLLGAAAGLLC